MNGNLGVSVSSIVAEVGRFSVLFLHVGSLFDPDAIVQRLVAELRETGAAPILAQVGNLPPSVNGDALIITGFEVAADDARRCEILSRARAQVMRHLDAGVRVIAVSRVPKARLTGCAGSQLILDARAVFLRPIEESNVRTVLLERGVSADEAGAITRFSVGLPILLSRFLAVYESGSVGSNGVRERKKLLDIALVEAVTEAGWETASLLEEAFAQDGSEFADTTNPLLLEALRGAGLTNFDDDLTEPVVPPPILGSLRLAVRSFLDSLVQPPAVVSAIVTDLWVIERSLRLYMQRAAVKTHGATGWRRNAFDATMQDAIVDRAWKDAAVSAKAIDEIGNPFDWLTLDELVSLTDREWAAVPTCPNVLWRRFLSEVLPVRNRLAHFRVPALDDADVVTKWRLDIGRRLDRAQAALDDDD